MEYSISIPSFQRVNILKTKTIKFLEKHSINKSCIYIFVANKDEYELYRKELPDYKIIIGELGITRQRNFIRNYFTEGSYVLSMDDDIEDLLMLTGGKLVSKENLHDFIIESFNICKVNKSGIFGVYPVNNAFFMKSRKPINNGLTFIIGCFFGQIISHDKELELDVGAESKEDILNSILNFKKYGKLLRFEHFTINTKFYSKGGLGAGAEREEINKKATLFLQENYGEYGKAWIRKNGKNEFRLKRLK